MKKTTLKRPGHRVKLLRAKTMRRLKGGASAAMPMEFERGWQELEAQHNRLMPDWGSLAAQLGIK